MGAQQRLKIEIAGIVNQDSITRPQQKAGDLVVAIVVIADDDAYSALHHAPNVEHHQHACLDRPYLRIGLQHDGGLIFWYRRLALGGIAGVGQLQLLQPFFGFVLAALFLGEPITWIMVASTIVLVGCVAGAKHCA